MTDRDRLGADSLREIRERIEAEVAKGFEFCCDSLGVTYAELLALVAEREALLAERDEWRDVAATLLRQRDESWPVVRSENAALAGRGAVLEAALRERDDALLYYADRRNHTTRDSGGTPHLWTNDAYDGNGPGARARAVLAGGDALPIDNLGGGDMIYHQSDARLAQALGWGDFRECSAAQQEQLAAWARDVGVTHLGNPHVRPELFAGGDAAPPGDVLGGGSAARSGGDA